MGVSGVISRVTRDLSIRHAELELVASNPATRDAVQPPRSAQLNQRFFPAGAHHDAFIEIRGVISSVTKSLLIVDPWVDHTLWALLSNVPTASLLRIMTKTMKGDFLLEATKFAKQHGCTVEIRQSASYHDRFIVIDETGCWHLGASIKDAGSKAFVISKIERKELIRGIIEDIESEWAKATVVA
jgi:hypothetical protein